MGEKNRNLKETNVVRRSGVGDVLSEVKLWRKAMYRDDRGNWVVDDPLLLGGVVGLEFTNAMEAVTDGFMFVTYQQWDDVQKQFLGYGQPILEMLQRGAQREGLPEFEQKRRSAEIEEELSLIQAYSQSRLTVFDKVTLSPFPDEVSPELAGQLGYKPDTKRAMFRIHEVNDKGQKTIRQVAVDTSDTEVFSQLLRRRFGLDLGYEITAGEVLAKSKDLFVKKKRNTDTLLELAKDYDQLLEAKYNRPFFLGRVGERGEDKDYQELSNKSKRVEEVAAGYVFELARFDWELAVSLEEGFPTELILKRIRTLVNMRDEEGMFVLPDSQRVLLESTLILCEEGYKNIFGEDQARLLKEKELVRMWTALAMVVNEERANKIFTEHEVKSIQKRVARGEDIQTVLKSVDVMIARRGSMLFYTCAGKFGEYTSLLGLSIDESLDVLFGDSELFVWKCGKCGFRNDINVLEGRLKSHCDSCGASGRC